MIKSIVIFFLAVILVLTGCGKPEPIADLDLEVEAWIYRMAAGYETKDLEGYLKFFSKDFLEIDDANTPEDPSDDKIIRCQELESAAKSFFGYSEQIKMKISSLDIKIGLHPAAGTFAKVYFSQEVRFGTRDGKILTRFANKQYTLYKKKETGWLIGPPMETISLPQDPASIGVQEIIKTIDSKFPENK